jgi:hypothetical protein
MNLEQIEINENENVCIYVNEHDESFWIHTSKHEFVLRSIDLHIMK